ncbi:hypothetical protein D3C77_646830 [compost metagenome]
MQAALPGFVTPGTGLHPQLQIIQVEVVVQAFPCQLQGGADQAYQVGTCTDSQKPWTGLRPCQRAQFGRCFQDVLDNRARVLGCPGVGAHQYSIAGNLQGGSAQPLVIAFSQGFTPLRRVLA